MSTTLDSTWLPGAATTTWPATTRERTEIVPDVWVSGHKSARTLWGSPGWTIIDVREMDTEADPPTVVKIPLLRTSAGGKAGRRALVEIADAIDAARRRGDRVLVHCWMGLERSPLSLVAWLVLRQGYTLDAAYSVLARRRGAFDCRDWLTRKARRSLNLAPRQAAA